MTDDRELKTASTQAKNYYYTGTIDNQESYRLAVNMCSGEMVSDTVLVMVEGKHMYTCHLQRGTIDDREGTYTLESSNQLEYSHVVHKILTSNDVYRHYLVN